MRPINDPVGFSNCNGCSTLKTAEWIPRLGTDHMLPHTQTKAPDQQVWCRRACRQPTGSRNSLSHTSRHKAASGHTGRHTHTRCQPHLAVPDHGRQGLTSTLGRGARRAPTRAQPPGHAVESRSTAAAGRRPRWPCHRDAARHTPAGGRTRARRRPAGRRSRRPRAAGRRVHPAAATAAGGATAWRSTARESSRQRGAGDM
mmetsp:Transcript_12067/g.30414  ORF Transcript_12067/g.30414 Transcript_12067/m.30414 type:complete len:201 (-) Transcript_12067:408-1010(-)